jgi:hypothetical protein
MTPNPTVTPLAMPAAGAVAGGAGHFAAAARGAAQE